MSRFCENAGLCRPDHLHYPDWECGNCAQNACLSFFYSYLGKRFICHVCGVSGLFGANDDYEPIEIKMPAKTINPELTEDDAFTLWLQTVKTVKEINSGQSKGDIKEAIDDMFLAEKTYLDLKRKSPNKSEKNVYYVLGGKNKKGEQVYYNDEKYLIAYGPNLGEACYYSSIEQAKAAQEYNHQFAKNLFHYVPMTVLAVTVEVSEAK